MPSMRLSASLSFSLRYVSVSCSFTLDAMARYVGLIFRCGR